MKIRILIKDDLEYVHEIPMKDVASYLDLLNKYSLFDENGDDYKVSFISVDAWQNVIEVSCVF